MEYGCIGEKLSHSFSKIIHNELCDYEYELKEIPRDKLDSFMKQRDFKAINVTIPYKQDVIPYLDFISDTAKSIGAVNTVVNNGGYLYGYNTDFSGMTALIKRNNIDIPHITALTIPSGECFFFTYMGFPQFGHFLALSLISFPHSGHLIKAMSNPSSF